MSRFRARVSPATLLILLLSGTACSHLQVNDRSDGGWLAQHLETPFPAPSLAPGSPPAAEVHRAVQQWSRSSREARGLVVLDDQIAESLNRLRQGSSTFDATMAQLERSRTPILIGTLDQLAELVPSPFRTGSGWAGLTLSWGAADNLSRSLVVVQMQWLTALAAREPETGGSDSHLRKELDRLMIHEVYGHLAPVVQARRLRANCPDARAGQRYTESCVAQREMEILRELGMAGTDR
jgi:hypothetical protein